MTLLSFFQTVLHKLGALLGNQNTMLQQIAALQKAAEDLQASLPAVQNLQTQVNTLTAQNANLQAALASAQAAQLDQASLDAITAVTNQIETVAQANAALAATPAGGTPTPTPAPTGS